MYRRFSNIFQSILVIIIIFLLIYIVFFKQTSTNKESSDMASSSSPIVAPILSDTRADIQENSGTKTFVFDNFHGSQNISLKFQFQYPSNWNNEGQYWSPEKIEYYDLYSVKAPMYFDLIRTDIFNQTEFKNQIDTDKRKSPDSHGKINYKEFKRYDLIDYGSYGGESAGRVIIYVGPEVIIDSLAYYLVFHWEEKPLTAVISGNDPAVFEKIVRSLKFLK